MAVWRDWRADVGLALMSRRLAELTPCAAGRDRPNPRTWPWIGRCVVGWFYATVKCSLFWRAKALVYYSAGGPAVSTAASPESIFESVHRGLHHAALWLVYFCSSARRSKRRFCCGHPGAERDSGNLLHGPSFHGQNAFRHQIQNDLCTGRKDDP